jgi:hypothetical protein
MPTLAQVVARQPQHFQDRYVTAYWAKWVNRLLERLGSEGMLPETVIQVGAVVKNGFWVDRPTDCRSVNHIYHAVSGSQYNWREVNGQLQLSGYSVIDTEAEFSSDTLTDFTVSGLTTNLEDIPKDRFAGWLMVVTDGTFEGRTYLLAGNEATDTVTGTTELEFLKPLSAAFVAAEVEEIELIPPSSFVILEYVRAYTEVSGGTDEIPVGDLFERELLDTWLTMQAEREGSILGPEAQEAERQFERVMMIRKGELRRVPKGPARGRWMPRIR